VLTVKSGLDPHMINELEDGLKSCSLVILAIFLWYLLSLCLMWVGKYLYFISNQVLIKLDQLKVLNAYSPVHYKAFAFILSPRLLSTISSHPCYKQCCSERGSCYEVVVKMLLVLRVRNPQSIACGVWCLRFQH
jgi:hypothetical protein